MINRTAVLSMVSVLISLFSIQALAWREGNGGDGLRINNKLYLLDLVEGGVEAQANDDSVSFSHSFFEAEMATWAARLPVVVPKEIILNKLGEIYRKNALLSYLVIISLQKLDWNWVNIPIKNVKDQGTVTVIDDPQLEQLAVRVNQTVYLQASLWAELNERNQAALIFHEALFSLVHPKRSPEGLSMSSPRVRKIVGFIFSNKIGFASLDELLKVEAPELRYVSTSMKSLQLFQYSVKSGEANFNAHWFLRAQNSLGETTILNELGLNDSDPKSVHHICEFSIEAHSTLYVGLNADVLRVTLGTDAQDAFEDYYLTHTYSSDTELITSAVSGNLTAEKCVQQINKAKKVLMSDFTSVQQEEML